MMRDNKANYYKLKIGIHLKIKKNAKIPQIPKIASNSKNDAFLLKLKNINLVSNYLKTSNLIQKRKTKNHNFSSSKDLSSDKDSSSLSLLLNNTTYTINNEHSSKKFPKPKKNIKFSFRKIEKDIIEKHSSRIKSTDLRKSTKINKSLIIPSHTKKTNENKTLYQKDNNTKINFKKHNTNNILKNLQYFNISNDDIIYEDPETTERGINNNMNVNEKPISKNLSNMNFNNIKQKNCKKINNRGSSRKRSETAKYKKLNKFNNPRFGEVEKYTKKNAPFIMKNKKLDSYRLKCKIWKTKTNEDLFPTKDNLEITEIYNKYLIKNKKNENELNNTYTNIYENNKSKNLKQRNINIKKKRSNDIVYRTVACINSCDKNKTDKNTINEKQKLNMKLSNNNEIKLRNKFYKYPIFSNKNRYQNQKNIIKKFRFSKSKEKNISIENENGRNQKKNFQRKKNVSVDTQKNIKKKENARISNASDIIDTDTIRSKSNGKKKDINIEKIKNVENHEDNINIEDILYNSEKSFDENKIDKFDELETIVRLIDFGTVSYAQIGIFSVVNNKYNNFIKEFDLRFKRDVKNFKKNKNNKEASKKNGKNNAKNILFNERSKKMNNNSTHKTRII